VTFPHMMPEFVRKKKCQIIQNLLCGGREKLPSQNVLCDIQDSNGSYIMIMQDNINNWRTTALILTSILFLAAGIWFIGKSSWKFLVDLLRRRILVCNFFYIYLLSEQENLILKSGTTGHE